MDEHTSDEVTCTKYCEEVISLDDTNEAVILLCAKIVKNLKELPSILKSVTSQDDLCSYLRYWSYEKIIDIFNKYPPKYNNYSVLNKLNYVLFTVNNDLKADKWCSYNFDGIFSKWEKEKELHDYFKNFEKINDNIDKKTSNCNTYLEYLKHISELYMKDLKYCCAYYTNPDPGYLEMCPKYFKCEKKYFPHSLISKLNCKNEKIDTNVDEIFKGLFVDLGVVTIIIKNDVLFE
ncbi:CYIR protein [Plasmodium cynomolgi strain B]|uniref:CYIR protein n=1 Tax=Plasmodium cynomolgi (strain B) TaxID=1120755 RepID=K6V2L8_PLACD|nr:CYIR protein [Plasmodium cynomolgi strain B]GAB69490.1 CYIR protein [Plasmodium cynomolgi strain B]